MSWSSYINLAEADKANVTMNENFGEINNAIIVVWVNAAWLADIITLNVATPLWFVF